MFRKINAGGVESDEGFSIQITGPETLKYQNEDFSVEIELEYDITSRKIYVHASRASNWDCFVGAQQIGSDKKLQLIKNITESIELLKGDFVVV